MELYIFLFCIPFFLFLIRPLVLLNSSNSRIKKRLPPGPNGLPILGSILRLGSKPHESLSKLAKIYGPVMTLRLGSITTVVATSPEVAKEILQKQDQTFANHPIPDAMASMPNPKGLLAWNLRDHTWRNRRRLCSTRLFTTQQLDSLQHLRHQKVKQLLTHIRKQADSNSQIDIGQLTLTTMLNLMSNTIFSTDVVKMESAEEFKEVIGRIMEAAGQPNLSDYFPALRKFDLQGIRCRVRQSYVRLHEIFDVLIHKRLESRASGSLETKESDFLDVLLDQGSREDDDGSDDDYSLDNIKTLILELFIAGSDTSSVTTEWAMTELLRNPNMMQKARNELMEVIGADEEVKESDMDRLPYLQAVAKETLRLHAAAPFLLPYVARVDTILCDFTIPQGTHIIVNAWAISRDSTYWDDPLSFKPERFIGSNVDFRGRDFEYIPFGAGPRICPAIPLATRMIHFMLASMIHSFDWKLPPGTTPENMNMEVQFGITLKKATPLCAFPIVGERK